MAAEIAIVQNAFQAFVSVVSLETIAETIHEQLRVLRMQPVNRAQEAQADVIIANGDVAIAQAEKANIQKQIDLIEQDIQAVQEQGFSLGGLLTTAGTIAVSLAGVASGPGAILSLIGFDVNHPEPSVTITDQAPLQAFAGGPALRFTIGLEKVPSGIAADWGLAA